MRMKALLIALALSIPMNARAEIRSLDSRGLITAATSGSRIFYATAAFEKNPDLEPLCRVSLLGGLPLLMSEKMTLRIGSEASLSRELNSVEVSGGLGGGLDAGWVAFGLGLERTQEIRLDDAAVDESRNFWGAEGGFRLTPWRPLSLFVEFKSFTLEWLRAPVLSAWAELAPFSSGKFFLKGVLSEGLLGVSAGWEQRISFVSFRIEFQPDPMMVSLGLMIPLGPVNLGYGLRVSPSLGLFHRASVGVFQEAASGSSGALLK